MRGLFARRGGRRILAMILLTTFSAGCAAPNIAPESMQAAILESPPSPTVAAATAAPTDPPPTPTVKPTTLPPLPSVKLTTPAPSPTAAPSSTPIPTAAPPTSTPIPTQQPTDPQLAAELQRILDDTVANGYIPGAVLAVHIPGQETWVGASGFIDRQQSQPLTPTTEMRIASISKVFTAVTVLQLVEEGRLDLDTPVAAWFPKLVPNAETITVRRLLNHTTGLYDYLEDKRFLNQAYQAPNYRWTPAELVAYAAKNPSLFSPGAPGAWDYSSTNYVILGMIVEQVTGNSMAQEVRDRILLPLGLEQTFFAPDEAVPGVQARGYRVAIDQTNISLSFAFATANLVSTVDDVQRFGDALFGGQLLRPETLDLMLTFENGKGQYNMPALEYGLGVMRNRLPVALDAQGRPRPAEASTVLGHTGGFGGFRSVLWHQPESGITIALGMNQGAADPNDLATRALDAILRSQGR